MGTKRLLWLAAVLWFAQSDAEAVLITNSWTNGVSSFWTNVTSWTAGAPTNTHSLVIITNAASKTVTINQTTSAGNLTISNLTMSGVGTGRNTLFLLNTMTVGRRLQIIGRMNVFTNSALIVSNSALLVQSAIGEDFVIDGAAILDGGTIDNSASGGLLILGQSGRGALTLKNGSILAQTFSFVNGTLTIAGGSLTTLDGFGAGGTTSVVSMTGGQLIVNGDTTIGSANVGTLTVTNATILAHQMFVTHNAASRGTITVQNGGTLALTGPLQIGSAANTTGTVWVTGGRLTVTNAPSAIIGSGIGVEVDGSVVLTNGSSLIVSNVGTVIGHAGSGNLTVHGGTLSVLGLFLGDTAGANGTFTLESGTARVRGLFQVGFVNGGTGTVNIKGGQLLVTNGPANIGFDGTGALTMLGGTFLATNLNVGPMTDSTGTFTVQGGTNFVSDTFRIGEPFCFADANVNFTSGAIFVTNGSGTAVLDIEKGQLTQTGGTLVMDKLIITNSCARYVKIGGSFSVLTSIAFDPNGDSDGDGMPNQFEIDNGLLIFDPRDAAQDKDGDGQSNLDEYLAGTSPTNVASVLRITDIVRQGNNLRITWSTAANKTNALERTAGAAGSFSNNFAAIFTVTNTVGTVTNYLDLGASTNVPALYYRVRLVP